MAGAFQSTSGGGQTQAFVTRLDPIGKLLYSTYLGGSGARVADVANDIAVDVSGNAYVTGTAGSANFPFLNAFQSERKGGSDAFVAKFGPSGSLVFSTFLGGSLSEFGYAIDVNAAGEAFVAGSTNSSDFPTAHAAQPAFGGPGTTCKSGFDNSCFDAFITRLSTDGKSLVYSTYLGGSETDVATGLTLDPGGNVFVTGYTNSSNFPTVQAPQAHLQGLQDAFLSRFDPSGTLLHSSYLGTSGINVGTSVAVVLPATSGIGAASTRTPTPLPTVTRPPGEEGLQVAVAVNTIDPATEKRTPTIWRYDPTTNTYQMETLASTLGSASSSAPFEYIHQVRRLGPQLAVIVDEPQASAVATHAPDGGGAYEKFCLTVNQGSTPIDDVHIKGDWIDPDVRPASTEGLEDWHMRPLEPPFDNVIEYEAELAAELKPGSQACFYLPVKQGNKVPNHVMVGLTTEDSHFNDVWTGVVDAAPVSAGQRARLRELQAAPSTHTGLLIFSLAPAAMTLAFWGDIHGSGNENGSGLATDPSGDVYVTGSTDSTGFPVFEAAQPSYGGGTSDGFVVKLANTTPFTLRSPTPTATPTATPVPTKPPAKSCPKHSSKKGKKCLCKKGYTLKKGKCVKKK